MGFDPLTRNSDLPPSGGCGPLRKGAGGGQMPLRQQLYERVLAHGRINRAALAKDLGVSAGAVTPLVSELLGTGLLQELPEDAVYTGRGRPPVTLAVVPGRAYVIGLKASDLEHTAVLVDLAGRPVASASMARDGTDRSATHLMSEMARLVSLLLDDAQTSRADVVGLGLGLPGLVDHSAGAVKWCPLLQERDVPVRDLLSDTLDLPVAIDNDANVLTMAEHWFGKGRRLSDFAVVTIEYGVGMGLVVDHQTYRGTRGLGMELGHIKVQLDGALCRCGQRGCLEAYVADYALVREAAVALSGTLPPRDGVLEALYAEAKGGNASAQAIFVRAGKYLALGLANVANLFDPSRIILSGSRLRYDYLFAEDILAGVASSTLTNPPPIEVHAWDDLVWARGAAALALSDATAKLIQ
ncbi:MAG: ROK family protein [Pseudomonadota bacterium]